MQHMNDDMDELFRKAAVEYPLDTRNSDWTKIAGGLQNITVPAIPVRKRYRAFRWLLLLIPLGLTILAFRHTISSYLDISQPPARAANSNFADKIATDDNATDLSYRDPGVINKTLKSRSAEGTIETRSSAIAADRIKTGLSSKGKKAKGGFTDPMTDTKKGKRVTSQHVSIMNKGAYGVGRERADTDKYRFKPKAIDWVPDMNGMEGNEINSIADREKISNTAATPDDALSSFDKPVKLFTETPDMDAVKIPVPVHIAHGRILKQQVKSNGVYLGAIIGLDVSSVKLQKFSGVGFHYGGTMGYQFAPKLSVEVGFYLSKKYYYTDGKYFDKGGLVVNPSSTIMEVDGACKMFEIPVSIKYDFRNTYKSNLFITGGFSSYIMKEEKYAMLYRYNSSGSTAVHDYTYKNSSKNYFAELRLTAGYAIKLPRSFSVRLEPYLNVPVNGVGSGKLNLMSTGVNAGLFKRIF